jgi:ABC-type sugar transport system ATPase subunit
VLAVGHGEGATGAARADIGYHRKEVGTLDLIVNTDIARIHCVRAVRDNEIVFVQERRAKEGLVLAKKLATTKFLH